MYKFENKEAEKAFDQFIYDIFVTAIEGGVNYWCDVNNYKCMLNGEDLIYDFYADLRDPDYDVTYVVNRDFVLKAYELASNSEWAERSIWSCGFPPKAEDFEKPPRYEFDLDQPWDFDAGDADIIIQLGLFSDIVFG
jgi:hypothetical protein